MLKTLVVLTLVGLSLSLLEDSASLKYLNDDNKVLASIRLDDGSSQYIVDNVYDQNYIAYAVYEPTLSQTGWDTLAISSYQGNDQVYSDYDKARAMGYLEGVLTHERIWDHFQNTKFSHYGTGEMPQDVQDFIDKNRKWVEEKGLTASSDAYWYHAHLLLVQLQGLVDGYNSVAPKDKQMTWMDMQINNIDAELTDISYIDPKRRPPIDKMTAEEFLDYIETNSRCSALIKISPDFSNLWFGHNTWTNYSSMNRIFKEYRLRTNDNSEKARTIAFSGYPGALSSMDDFYITDKDLYVAETTNEPFNNDLWNLLSTNTVPTWQRTMLANRLTDNAKDWAFVYTKYNSGTYNNQFQVLDLKLIDTKNGVVGDNALWIVEQIPGLVKSADKSDILRLGYWPSYNSAYFQEIRDLAQYDARIKAKPETRDSLDYNTCGRANIFRRDQGKITDLEGFKSLMRYNDFQHDPMSKGLPNLSIANRSDLAKTPKCRGAIDAKVASIHDIQGKSKKRINIIAGPTTQTQIPFRTDSQCTKTGEYVYNGLPEEFNFPWVVYETLLFDN
jgi:hypothetical protein